jgi:hypothetical protein
VDGSVPSEQTGKVDSGVIRRPLSCPRCAPEKLGENPRGIIRIWCSVRANRKQILNGQFQGQAVLQTLIGNSCRDSVPTNMARGQRNLYSGLFQGHRVYHKQISIIFPLFVSVGPYTYTCTRINVQPNHLGLEYGASMELQNVDITAYMLYPNISGVFRFPER